ncbi:MAG: hypothetical protein AAGG01_00935, partial [Planctomycetota bacterium]
MKNPILIPLFLGTIGTFGSTAFALQVNGSPLEGDVTLYGQTNTGAATSNPRRMTITGNPAPGGTVIVRGKGFRPFERLFLRIGNAPIDRALPSGSRRLVDLNGSSRRGLVADANGEVDLSLPIASSMPLETTLFLQLEGKNDQSQLVTSNAGELTIGEATDDLVQQSIVAGRLVTGSQEVADVSGVVTTRTSCNNWDLGELLGAGFIMETGRFSHSGSNIDSLFISNGAEDPVVTALGGDAFRIDRDWILLVTPANSDSIFVKATGQAYVDDFSASIVLDPLPSTAGSLAGMSFAFESGFADMASSYYSHPLENSMFPDGFDYWQLTDQDADTALIETHTSLQAAHTNWNSNDPVFSDAPVPNYSELLDREGVFLDYETDGAATSLDDLVNMTKTGEMTVAAAARLTLWAKILIIFDLEDEWKEFKEFEELLKDEFGDDFKKFGDDVKGRKFKKAKKR